MPDIETIAIGAGLMGLWIGGCIGLFVGVLMSVCGRWEREDETQRIGDAGPTVDARGRRL